MIPGSMEQFMAAMLRMKKAAACFTPTDNLQFSEIVIMYKASTGCGLEGGGFSASEIQRVIHITKPAVSQSLNNLEKKGFIVRSIDRTDRRKIIVTLTPEGEAELQDAMQCQNAAMEKVYTQFGEENIRQLVLLVNRLMDILEELDIDNNDERCE